MGTGSFPGVKRPRRGADHPPPSSAKVEGRVEPYIYSPSGSSWPVIGWTLPLLYLTFYFVNRLFPSQCCKFSSCLSRNVTRSDIRKHFSSKQGIREEHFVQLEGIRVNFLFWTSPVETLPALHSRTSSGHWYVYSEKSVSRSLFRLPLRSNKTKTVPPTVFPACCPSSCPSTCSVIQDQLLNVLWFFTELEINVFRNRLSSQRQFRENRRSRFLPLVAIRISLHTQPHWHKMPPCNTSILNAVGKELIYRPFDSTFADCLSCDPCDPSINLPFSN